MEKAAYLEGQFLLAMPGIGDPRFERSVIALCAHDARGALGVGVGTEVDHFGLHALLEQLGIDPGVAEDRPIHVGGPVEQQRGFVLHSPDWMGGESLAVGKRWGLTSTLDVLQAIARGEGPAHYLVAMGYAGWGEGQLDDELRHHGWFAHPGKDSLLFDVPTADRWVKGFAEAGVDVRLLATRMGTA